jgi:hypothetical protein
VLEAGVALGSPAGGGRLQENGGGERERIFERERLRERTFERETRKDDESGEKEKEDSKKWEKEQPKKKDSS